MGCRFVIDNLALAANYEPWTSNYVPINSDGFLAFADPSPAHVCRLPVFGGLTMFYADLGMPHAIDTVALVNTNLGSGSYVACSGSLDVPTLVWPANIWTMSATLGDRSRSRHQVTLSMSGTAVVTRYVTFYIIGSNPFTDIGQIVIGNSWRAGYFNVQYGLGRVDMGTREVNQQTGVAFDFKGARLRVQTLTLGVLTQAEARTYVDDIDRIQGATGDIFFIPDDQQSYQVMSEQAIYGSCRPSGDAFAAHVFNNVLQRPLRVQERG